ncbi:hypothetical protein CYMTET_54675 [Cymbomonas tetramitiformis]|uniref:Uncharacterized protein n=1 Tax=Cymbomonas tetramitiformis TaxID=36881 RepID=A0AAE0BEF5_9CHLO|nr:hypothetical protein CYMTET_54675 [Cymbomonas tetramitiformis]
MATGRSCLPPACSSPHPLCALIGQGQACLNLLSSRGGGAGLCPKQMLQMMPAVRTVAPLQMVPCQLRILLGACGLGARRLLSTDRGAADVGFQVGGAGRPPLRTVASTGSSVEGGGHTGTAPPRAPPQGSVSHRPEPHALGLPVCLDYRSVPRLTNPCHLSAHRCWPRIEDSRLSAKSGRCMPRRFFTGAAQPRPLHRGCGQWNPGVDLGVLTGTSRGRTSWLADSGARRPHLRHYVAAAGGGQHSGQRRSAGRRSTASPAQQLKEDIIACFDKLRAAPRVAKLDAIVRENHAAMTPASAVTLMHRCAKTLKDRNSRNHVDVRPYLSMIVNVVDRPRVLGSMVHISMALYALQSLGSNEPNVKALLRALAPKVKDCKEELSAQAVGNALYGLQGMGSKEPEVKAMLRALTPKVKDCKEKLSAQAVGNALYGLQSMGSKEPEVKAMLQALALKVQDCKEELSAQAVGNALYGLQGMGSNEPEVKAILQALALKVQDCKEELSAQAVDSALYGLQAWGQ